MNIARTTCIPDKRNFHGALVAKARQITFVTRKRISRGQKTKVQDASPKLCIRRTAKTVLRSEHARLNTVPLLQHVSHVWVSGTLPSIWYVVRYRALSRNLKHSVGVSRRSWAAAGTLWFDWIYLFRCKKIARWWELGFSDRLSCTNKILDLYLHKVQLLRLQIKRPQAPVCAQNVHLEDIFSLKERKRGMTGGAARKVATKTQRGHYW